MVSDATRDHIVPRAKGGLTRLDNLICACVTCNQRKGDMDLEEFRQRHHGGQAFWFEAMECGHE